MKPIPVIVIFDVGKTNKKLFIFDKHYKVLHESITRFSEVLDEDGYPCEDVEKLTQWVRSSLDKLIADKTFEIKAVNFSAYGASFVHLNENGKVIAPIYNYLKPYPEDLKKKFYDTYGSEATFSKTTASPALGSLNSGMVLYLLKYEKPALFNSIKYSLHLPQYLSFLVSGKMCSEMTSIGCHTNLWDFSRHNYHAWVNKEKADEKLPPIFLSDHVTNISLAGKSILVGVGMHDSSAALIPYLKSFQKPFVLISTGTWCISLNPFNQNALTAEELEQDCLFYLSYAGKPVKASRLFAGNEHEVQIKRLASHFNADLNFHETVQYDPAIVAELSNSRSNRNKFSERNLSDYSSYKEAYHRLMMDIIAQQVISTNMVLKHSPAEQLFVDGGFAKNALYMNLLSQAYPALKVFAATVSQATALGAAVAIHDHWNSGKLPADIIRLKPFESRTRQTSEITFPE